MAPRLHEIQPEIQPGIQPEIQPGIQHWAQVAVQSRTASFLRDPLVMERTLGVVLWLAFFAVLFSLGE